MTEQSPTFLDPASRRRAVQLQFPIVYDGREYRAIYIARPTAADIAAWADSQEAENPADRKPLRILVGEGGVEIPAAVVAALDLDDADEVNKVFVDFLPRRLQVVFSLESSADDSTPATGDITAP